jgi:hypothetical protein
MLEEVKISLLEPKDLHLKNLSRFKDRSPRALGFEKYTFSTNLPAEFEN